MRAAIASNYDEDFTPFNSFEPLILETIDAAKITDLRCPMNRYTMTS